MASFLFLGEVRERYGVFLFLSSFHFLDGQKTKDPKGKKGAGFGGGGIPWEEQISELKHQELKYISPGEKKVVFGFFGLILTPLLPHYLLMYTNGRRGGEMNN